MNNNLQAAKWMTFGSLGVHGKEGQTILESWGAHRQTRGKRENGLFLWLHEIPCTDVKVLFSTAQQEVF